MQNLKSELKAICIKSLAVMRTSVSFDFELEKDYRFPIRTNLFTNIYTVLATIHLKHCR